MNKWFLVLLLFFLSCFKFEFESPYEDLNGIYLQWMGYYGVTAKKMVVSGKIGYFLPPHHSSRYLESYTISIDSVYNLRRYTSNNTISDFEVFDGFGFLVAPSFGLEIVNFQDSQPFLYGELEVPGVQMIRIRNNYAYLLGDNNFYVIDISNRQNPKKITEHILDAGAKWLEVDSNLAYVLLKNSDFFILNIENPSNPNLILQARLDIFPEIPMFIINNNYIHFLTIHGIMTYYFKEGADLVYQATLGFPENISFIYGNDKYGLALGSKTIYLLNLEYPDRPCVSEMMSIPGGADYGIINGNYIYLLTPYLNIIEIKELPK